MWEKLLRYFDSEAAFMEEVCARARARRRADRDKDDDGRPDVGYRGEADMCYAFSVKDGRFYVGYSAGAGGMYQRGRFMGTPQADRRLDRLERSLDIDWQADPQRLRRPICNCAEAAALSVATSWDQELRDLIFVTFYPVGKGNGLKSPCSNCRTWIVNAYGYYADGRLVPGEPQLTH